MLLVIKIPLCVSSIQLKNPSLRWKTHPERIANMKNLTPSELSRRRLVPAQNPRRKPAADGATNTPSVANAVQNESSGSNAATESGVKDLD